MKSGMKVYSTTYNYNGTIIKDTIFEVWGGSTKHPDVRRHLSTDKEESRFTQSSLITSPEYEVFQWVCQCISELSFGSYALMKEWLEMNSDFEKCSIY